MRILEYGCIKPDIIKCTSCDAKLEYTENDIKRRWVGPILFKMVHCPACGKPIIMEAICE